jgi:two-component system sensor histidine kinase YesM
VFIFKVEDSGDGMADEDLKAFQTILMNPQQSLEKTGLLNISRRLKLKYGSQSGIYLGANEMGGLTSKLIIHFTGKIQLEGQEVN